MDELSAVERIWLNTFRVAHGDVHIDHLGRVWTAAVPLAGDGERTLKFDSFRAMRSWLDRWAAGR